MGLRTAVTSWLQYAEISPDWIAHGKIRFTIDCWRRLTPRPFGDRCEIVRLGRQETIAAADKRLAAE